MTNPSSDLLQNKSPAAPPAEPPTGLKVVTQRVVSGRLLVDADKDVWASFNRGLILHVSFTKFFSIMKSSTAENEKQEADEETSKEFTHLKKICKSLLTASLSSTNAWEKDHSDAKSVVDLCKQGQDQCLVLIPQASLTAKLNPGDKTLKYHSQCGKEEAEVLYRLFRKALAAVVVEQLCCGAAVSGSGCSTTAGRHKDKPGKFRPDGRMIGIGGKSQSNDERVNLPPPEEFFRSGEYRNWEQQQQDESTAANQEHEFSTFDDSGFPVTAAATGEPVAKSRRKKLEKMWAKYKQKYEQKNVATTRQAPTSTQQTQTERTSGGSTSQIVDERVGQKNVGNVASDTGNKGAANIKQLPAEEISTKSSTTAPQEQLAHPEKPSTELQQKGTDGPTDSTLRPCVLETAKPSDPAFRLPTIVTGTFGGRQGLELCTGGPFTHSFNFPPPAGSGG
ncbi:unnamed protein product [Amoebophrya sp. A120]|nr:unnamed protein product [Amoebophrya sp. A120]|eukprot:GSA120T00000267001.1